MWNTFKYSLIALIKEKNILIWALIFPLFLASLFHIMFSNLDDASKFAPIPTALVEDAGYHSSEAFKEMVETLSEEGEAQILAAHYVKTAEDAEALLKAQDVIGYYQIGPEGSPRLFVTTPSRLDSLDAINQTILKNILDTYTRSQATIETIARENPLALTDPATMETLRSPATFTEEISVIAHAASGSVRYFYVLLGFAAIMAANIGMIAITRTQANLSPLGARRAVGATSRSKTLLATLLASWVLAFLCLALAFCYMRFILGIHFGGRDAVCLFGLAVASLMAIALGTFIGSVPKLKEGSKAGILTGLTCFSALFAGLYGASSMRLADEITRTAPLLQMINPSKQVADMFYSLYFYDTYTPFFSAVTVLLVMSAALFLAAAILMRRQRYASL